MGSQSRLADYGGGPFGPPRSRGTSPHVSRCLAPTSPTGRGASITTDLNGVYFVDMSLTSNPATKTGQGANSANMKAKPTLGSRANSGLRLRACFRQQGAGDLHPCYFLPENTLGAFVPNKALTGHHWTALRCSHTNPKTFKFFKAYKSF